MSGISKQRANRKKNCCEGSHVVKVPNSTVISNIAASESLTPNKSNQVKGRNDENGPKFGNHGVVIETIART